MVVSTHLAYYQGYREGDFTEIDGSRIAASVVSGIGFLAGGAILRTGATIQGLTTAAGLWLVTAIGLSAGARMYFEAGGRPPPWGVPPPPPRPPLGKKAPPITPGALPLPAPPPRPA